MSWENFWKLISVVVVPFVLWMSYTTNSIDRRLIAIEANRFTAQEGTAVWQAIEQRPTRDEVPPEWFLTEVRALQAEMRALRVEISALRNGE